MLHVALGQWAVAVDGWGEAAALCIASDRGPSLFDWYARALRHYAVLAPRCR